MVLVQLSKNLYSILIIYLLQNNCYMYFVFKIIITSIKFANVLIVVFSLRLFMYASYSACVLYSYIYCRF